MIQIVSTAIMTYWLEIIFKEEKKKKRQSLNFKTKYSAFTFLYW